MFDGMINVYKEKGYTSHDVVAKLRGILKMKKIGHTGTLDPDAEGVLPVCLGKGTKLCNMLTDQNKVYEAVMLLGVTTDTQDVTGRVLEETKGMVLEEAAVKAVIYSFIGEYSQIPPMYSAVKINGKKLYELAREGIEVERNPRNVTILDIQILEFSFPRVRMTVSCSKGTYIRTLCHDIGQKLGVGACMEKLTRVKAGAFDIGDSLTLKRIEQLRDSGGLEKYIVPVDQIFETYPAVTVKKEFEKRILNGNSFLECHLAEKNKDVIGNKEKVRVYDAGHIFVGIYSYDDGKKEYLPEKMFL